MKTNYYVQFAGREVEESEVVAKIKDVWKDSGRLVKEIKSLDVYVKPEEGRAYYTINGEETGQVAL